MNHGNPIYCQLPLYNIYTLDSGKISKIWDEIKIKLRCSEDIMRIKFGWDEN